MDKDFIRNRITELRMKKDISERELSFALNKAGNYINNITSGKALPLMENFLDICEYFDITPFEFFYPGLDNPIISKKIYSELIRLSDNNLDKFLPVLEAMEPKEFNMILELIDKITFNKYKTLKP